MVRPIRARTSLFDEQYGHKSEHEIQHETSEKEGYERKSFSAAESAKKHYARIDGSQKHSADCCDKYLCHRKTARKGYEDKAVSGPHRPPGYKREEEKKYPGEQR